MITNQTQNTKDPIGLWTFPPFPWLVLTTHLCMFKYNTPCVCVCVCKSISVQTKEIQKSRSSVHEGHPAVHLFGFPASAGCGLPPSVSGTSRPTAQPCCSYLSLSFRSTALPPLPPPPLLTLLGSPPCRHLWWGSRGEMAAGPPHANTFTY